MLEGTNSIMTSPESTMKSTIIAYADIPGVRVDRLVWSLATRTRGQCDLILVDLCPEADPGLVNQLNLYRTAFKWAIVRHKADGDPLGDLVKGDTVISLPASSIPLGDSINTLASCSDEAVARCRPIGPYCNYAMDDMGANLTRDMVITSPHHPTVHAHSSSQRNWRRPADDIRTIALADTAEFVLCPPPQAVYHPRPNNLVAVLAKNP